MLLFVKIKYAVLKTYGAAVWVSKALLNSMVRFFFLNKNFKAWRCHRFSTGRCPALYEQLAEYNAGFQAT